MQSIPHNILIIETNILTVFSVQMPNQQQLDALSDCECYIIIDPLNNTQYREGNWEPILTAHIHQDGAIVQVH